MNPKFIKPDFKNSNVNISATLAEYLGAPNRNAILDDVMEELNKGYKNIVFICFDGMGINPIEKNLMPDDFIRKNIKRTLTSTFPSTTTNATTSLLLNKLPLEHGWFGWSMNFKNINRNIDIFMNTDSWTGEKVKITDSPLAGKDYYFDHTNSEYEINTVFPGFVEVKHAERNNVFNSEEEFFAYINMACQKEGKQFVYAYFPDPDSTMHEYGVSSLPAKCVMESISKNLEKLYNDTFDTLFIVTADHGQVDIEKFIHLYKDAELMNMLEIYPYMESRAVAFKVKEDKKQIFEKYFVDNYGQYFELFKSSDMIEDGFFGDFGDKGYMLGDYIAVAYENVQACLTPISPELKGHHTSLAEEMLVPLIILNN